MGQLANLVHLEKLRLGCLPSFKMLLSFTWEKYLESH